MPPDPRTLRRLLAQERYEEVFEILLPAVSDKLTTRKNVLSGWRNYLQWLMETGESLLHFDQPDQHYPLWLKAQAAAPATLNNRLVQVRKLYQLLLDLELVSFNPFLGSQGEKNPVHHRRVVYSAAEVQRLLIHANAEERLLILLATEAGLAGSEVRELNFEDVTGQAPQLHVRRIRYRQEGFKPEQDIPASPALQDALSQWLKMRGAAPLFQAIPSGFLFEENCQPLTDQQLLWKLRLLCQKANVTYKPWRALRHVSGIQRLKSKSSRESIQHDLGLQRLDPLLKLAGAEDGRRLRWKKK